MVTMAELSIIFLATDLNAWADLAHRMPLCETEDSHNCVWVANIQGDKDGESFIALYNEIDETVTMIYRPTPEGEAQIVTYPR